MAQQHPLAAAALQLRNAAPREWDAFVNQFATYAAEVTVAVIEAEADTIMTMKGRAQQMQAVTKMLRECHQTPPQAEPPMSL